MNGAGFATKAQVNRPFRAFPSYSTRWFEEPTEITSIQEKLSDDEKNNLCKNRYCYHEILVKKLLQRSNNLRRVNFFTTNYDMAFDYALDNLGVDYINGFMGVHNRCFRPEVYDYDLYYPGQSVSGKVHRAEKVLKYYKLHGSLSWVSAEATFSNSYGICELPLNNLSGKINKELLIYPCSTKKTFTLDLPYSELFRQFSQPNFAKIHLKTAIIRTFQRCPVCQLVLG